MSNRTNEINESLSITEELNTLTFGTDAYLLSAFLPTRKNSVCAELGAGSGVISLLGAKKEKFSLCHAIEIQKEIYGLSLKNVKENSLEERVIPLNADIRDISSASLGHEVDIVFSNPPYMRADSGKANERSEKYIARHEVCGSISDFCSAASKILKFGGHFYCVYRPDRLPELICSLRAWGLEPKRVTLVYPDSDSTPCILLVDSVKGGSEGCFTTPPLILYKSTDKNGKREYTADAEYIYENCAFPPKFTKA